MKEDEVYLQLTAWFQNHGIDVFWNKKNNFAETFYTRGQTTRKGDLIIEKTFPWGEIVCGVVEVKIERGRDIRSARKILDYYNDYITGKIRYFIKGRILEPRYFLVGSKHSVDGKLFMNDNKLYQKSKKGDDIRKKRPDMFPQDEYSRTFDFTRSIWTEFRERYEKNKKFKIGVLLSGVLDKEENHPAIFCMEHRGNRWNQKWLKLKR